MPLALATHHPPLFSPFKSFPFILLQTILHDGSLSTPFQSTGYTLFSSQRRVYPWLCYFRLASFGNGSNLALLLTPLPPYFLTSLRPCLPLPLQSLRFLQGVA